MPLAQAPSRIGRGAKDRLKHSAPRLELTPRMRCKGPSSPFLLEMKGVSFFRTSYAANVAGECYGSFRLCRFPSREESGRLPLSPEVKELMASKARHLAHDNIPLLPTAIHRTSLEQEPLSNQFEECVFLPLSLMLFSLQDIGNKWHPLDASRNSFSTHIAPVHIFEAQHDGTQVFPKKIRTIIFFDEGEAMLCREEERF